jgi:hypothetical protein
VGVAEVLTLARRDVSYWTRLTGDADGLISTDEVFGKHSVLRTGDG